MSPWKVATEASLWVGVASVFLLWMVFSWKRFWLRVCGHVGSCAHAEGGRHTQCLLLVQAAALGREVGWRS